MAGEIADEANTCIRAFSEHLKCEIIELNARIDHVHLLAKVPPKVALSDYVGTINPHCAVKQRFPFSPCILRLLEVCLS